MPTSRLSAHDRHTVLADDDPDIFFSHSRPTPLVQRRSPSGRSTLDQHVEAVCHYGGIIDRVAADCGLLPSVIAGFGSRQSGWGLDLSPLGPFGSTDFAPRHYRTGERQGVLPPDGDGFARGLMQLDYDEHDIARGREWQDPEANIVAACDAIVTNRAYLRKRTMLQGFGLLRAAFAAFDCGLEHVLHATRQGLDVDAVTTNQNFGRDVLERADFFQAHGWD